MTQVKTGAAAVAAIAVLTSCSSDDPAANPTAGNDEPTTSSSTPAGYEIVPDESALIASGPWAVRAEGLPDAPLAVFDVPAGFYGGGPHIWTSKGRIGYFNPTGVYDNPCSDAGDAHSAAGTVEDFAAALRAQKLTTTAPPVPVSVDGHKGLYLEMTAPTDLDVEKCRDGVLTVWENGPLFLDDEPLVERLWILDVDGQRVVLDAGVPAGATDQVVRLFTGVVRTATFVEG